MSKNSTLCGNGIVDPGEDCDCGTTCSTNRCCSTSCTFEDGAICDSEDPLQTCCTACRISGVSTKPCRPSLGACDTAEFCTGSSPFCPTDVRLPNGERCGRSGVGNPGEQLYCASGVCTSRTEQCRKGEVGKGIIAREGEGWFAVNGWCRYEVEEKWDAKAACEAKCDVKWAEKRTVELEDGGKGEDWWWKEDCRGGGRGDAFLNGTDCSYKGEDGECVGGECILLGTRVREDDNPPRPTDYTNWITSNKRRGPALSLILPIVLVSILLLLLAVCFGLKFRGDKERKREEKRKRREEEAIAAAEGSFAPVSRPIFPRPGGEAFAPTEVDMEVAASTGRAAWGSAEGSFAPGEDQKEELREVVVLPKQEELREDVVPEEELVDEVGTRKDRGQEAGAKVDKGKGKEKETVET